MVRRRRTSRREPWLACLGALRRLWPVPPLTAGEVDPLLWSLSDAPPIVDPALAFWHCLRVAETPACPVDSCAVSRRGRVAEARADR